MYVSVVVVVVVTGKGVQGTARADTGSRVTLLYFTGSLTRSSPPLSHPVPHSITSYLRARRPTTPALPRRLPGKEEIKVS